MTSPPGRQGVLAGVRVIEFAGLGPAPFCAMMLADHGADVIRIARPTDATSLDEADDFLLRSRRAIAIDLKIPAGLSLAERLCATADIVIEGFRPGVLERLGLAPESLLAANPKLVIGRMTGWGQSGPLAQAAGHDINYIALTGALHAIGPAEGPPVPPLNLVGDFGGGGMMLAFGVIAALLAARATGQGQVVDSAMVDGTAVLMAMTYSLRAQNAWQDRRAANLLDGGAPFYGCYLTADGGWLAVGAIEPAFYAALLEGLGLQDDPLFSVQNDSARWPAQRTRIAEIVARRSRAQWTEIFQRDACVTPVLSLHEAPDHPQNQARGVFAAARGGWQPMPAPRFGNSPSPPSNPLAIGLETAWSIAREVGLDDAAFDQLASQGIIG